ncbi:UNVERIFIED_CONTAM: hypothetical protein DES50_12513 [Williamsia faeni]
MSTGVLFVESQPSSPDEISEFHTWYDDVHIPEILQVEGFISARRLESLDGTTYIAIYEIDTDVEAAKASLTAAFSAGTMTKPSGVQLNPPPTQRYFRIISEDRS